MQPDELLAHPLLGNPVRAWLWSAGILLVGGLLRRPASVALTRLLYRLVSGRRHFVPLAQFLDLLRKPFELLTLLLVAYLAGAPLAFPPDWPLVAPPQLGLRLVVRKSYLILLFVACTWVVLRVVEFFGQVFIQKAARTASPLDDQMAPFFKELAKVVVVTCSFFTLLGTVFALDVASVFTGLGIGGLALALAAKESLENLFASFTIFLDRPFVVGDIVQVGTITGVVERVGFRSTRIRTFDRSTVTVPNKMLTDQALDNLTWRQFRRAKFNIHLPFDTPADTLRAIVADIQAALDAHPLTQREPGVVRFEAIADYAYRVLVIFFVETAQWEVYIQAKEALNYQILEIVQQRGATLALPTSTVQLTPDFFAEKRAFP